MIILWAEDWRYKSKDFINELFDNAAISGLVVIAGKGSDITYQVDMKRYSNSFNNIATNNLDHQNRYPELRKLLPLPIASKSWTDWNCGGFIYHWKQYLTIMETSIKNFQEIERRCIVAEHKFKVCLVNKNIILRNRIIKTWQKLDKIYGERHSLICIDLKKDESIFDELIKYAIDTNKEILLDASRKVDYNYLAFFRALNRQKFNSRITRTTQGSWL